MSAPEQPSTQSELDREFERLLSMAAAQREKALQALAQDSPQLADPLRELLDLAERMDSGAEASRLQCRLRAPVALWQALDTLTTGGYSGQEPFASEIPERIGAWRLLRELGSGGMGRVYLVERIDAGFEQRAALKRIRTDVDSGIFLAHFARERQILARLAHPGIARLIDGGEEPSGRPYLVVEYVEGEALDVHCDRGRLDLPARLDLWRQAAEALAYAHAQGVVHRDIKPSNLMVSSDSAVKLLDFGIAKSSARMGEHTATASGLLTPQWASPEQVLGLPVEEASDQYQLALLLYVLLTGVHPQRPRDGDELAWMKRVCEEAPKPPSRAVRDVTMGASESERRRQRSRRLSGDLDRILLKALSKSPEQRYPSVRDFVDDIERWRCGFPVRARRPGVIYRLRRFISRQPGASAAALTAVILLAVYVISLGRHARDLEQQRDLAEQAARQAQQSQQLMMRLFEQADPEQSGQSDLSLREALATGLASLEHELSGQPQLEYPLLLTLARVHQQLGLPQQAQLLLQRAEEMEPRTAVEPLSQLERQRLSAVVAETLGDANSARDQLQRIIERAESLQSPQALELGLKARTDLGWLEHRAGQVTAALASFEAVFELRQRQSEPLAMARAAEDLGVALRNAGRYADAEPLLRRTHEINSAELPPAHPLLVHSRVNLAAVLRSLGRETEAEALYREALLGSVQVRGERHPGTAVIQNNLARLLKTQGRLEEAEALLQAALSTRSERLGDRHPLVAMTYSDLGWLLHDKGDLEGAQHQYAQALARFPSEHPWRAATVFNLGRVHEARKEFGQAETLYRQALESQIAEYGPLHERVGIDWLQLGGVLRKQKRMDASAQALEQAERVFAVALPESHDRFVQLWIARAELADDLGDHSAAEALWQRALAQRTRALGAKDARTIALQRRISER